jgi:hypothetical protein
MPYIKIMMGELYLKKATLKPKRILITGLGIGVLQRVFNQIIPKDFHIDVVEIDERNMCAWKVFHRKIFAKNTEATK